MKILHTADLHLDSPFGGNPLESERRREQQRTVLKKIFATAKERQCEMIVIAGDLFDGNYVTSVTERLCLRLFREAEVPVILAPGNHDPYVEGSFYRRTDLPDNVFVFTSPELQCFDFDRLNVKVFGYAFCGVSHPQRPLADAPLPEEDGMWRILCAHADLGVAVSRYAPMTAEEAVRLGMDYVALGHVHRPPAPLEREGTLFCYSGIPQGRGFDESGDGHVLLVTLEEGKKPTAEPIAVSEERYLWEELDLGAVDDETQLKEKIAWAAQTYAASGRTHLRLTLTGSVDPQWISDLKASGAFEQGDLAELELDDRTLPFADGAYLERDTTLRGAFYRSLLPKLIGDDPRERRLALRALQIGLAAIENRPIPQEEQS